MGVVGSILNGEASDKNQIISDDDENQGSNSITDTTQYPAQEHRSSAPKFAPSSLNEDCPHIFPTVSDQLTMAPKSVHSNSGATACKQASETPPFSSSTSERGVTTPVTEITAEAVEGTQHEVTRQLNTVIPKRIRRRVRCRTGMKCDPLLEHRLKLADRHRSVMENESRQFYSLGGTMSRSDFVNKQQPAVASHSDNSNVVHGANGRNSATSGPRPESAEENYVLFSSGLNDIHLKQHGDVLKGKRHFNDCSDAGSSVQCDGFTTARRVGTTESVEECCEGPAKKPRRVTPVHLEPTTSPESDEQVKNLAENEGDGLVTFSPVIGDEVLGDQDDDYCVVYMDDVHLMPDGALQVAIAAVSGAMLDKPVEDVLAAENGLNKMAEEDLLNRGLPTTSGDEILLSDKCDDGHANTEADSFARAMPSHVHSTTVVGVASPLNNLPTLRWSPDETTSIGELEVSQGSYPTRKRSTSTSVSNEDDDQTQPTAPPHGPKRRRTHCGSDSVKGRDQPATEETESASWRLRAPDSSTPVPQSEVVGSPLSQSPSASQSPPLLSDTSPGSSPSEPSSSSATPTLVGKTILNSQDDDITVPLLNTQESFTCFNYGLFEDRSVWSDDQLKRLCGQLGISVGPDVTAVEETGEEVQRADVVESLTRFHRFKLFRHDQDAELARERGNQGSNFLLVPVRTNSNSELPDFLLLPNFQTVT
eukprot:GHVN01001040.1.p2 GENE.GHVN01001040.1~~GHVN01001040.1.p2  ORF type:complete len:706 (+),score=98.20 GHVN01001040.1:117-2234(+)